MGSKRLMSVFCGKLNAFRMCDSASGFGLGERLRPEKNTNTVNLVNARIAEN
jgi:hypothetical protein